MKIESLTPEERRHEVAVLLGRALRRVLERPAPISANSPEKGETPNTTCFDAKTERACGAVNNGNR